MVELSRFFFALANHLSRDIFDITILVVNDDRSLSQSLKSDVSFICLNKTRVLYSSFNIYRSIQRARPDIILSTSNHLNAILMLIKPFLCKKKIIVYREINDIEMVFKDSKGLVCNLIKRIYKWCINQETMMISQSQSMRAGLLRSYKLNPSNVKQIYNPVVGCQSGGAVLNVSNELNLGQEKHRLVSIGRLEAQKDYSLLINAMRHLDERFHLVIVGDGTQMALLKKLVDTLGLKERVKLLGQQEDVIPWLNTSTLFVLPSIYEGFPNVVLEAFSCGLPAIVTNFACAKELITKDNGLICKSRLPKDLALCIEQASKTAYDNKKIMRDVKERFGIEKISKQYETTLVEFYEKKRKYCFSN